MLGAMDLKRVVVDTRALKNNYDRIRETVNDDTVIYFVVKGNAYGLDTKQYVNEMIKLGADHFATAETWDAVYIKSVYPSAEVLLLTPINADQTARLVVEHGIVATVENADGAALIAKYAKEPHPVHIKIDVGFGRYGVKAANKDELMNICQTDNISIEGVFTHLPNSADKHTVDAQKMLDKFFECVEYMRSIGIHPKMVHALGSVGVFRFFDERSTAVRVGSAMMGRMPAIVGDKGLENVVWLESSVKSIKHIKKGESVGYSSLYKAKRDTVSAIVDVGYADGFSMIKTPISFRRRDVLRHIKHELGQLVKKSCIRAKINGISVKVIGAVGMSVTSFDVTGLDVNVSDTVVLDINPIHINACVPRIYR